MAFEMIIKEKYINPFTDFGFKKLFGTELNKDLLIDFLNEVILPEGRRITDLTYGKNDHPGKSEFDRKAVFDLYCTGTTGEHFIVEMQKAKQTYYKDRSVYYATFPIQEQANQGFWDFKLPEVFTVGILDFVFNDYNSPNERKEVRHEVKLKDQNCQVFYDKLTFVYLEMPNFTKTEEELVTTYDKWLYVLKNLPRLANRPEKLQEKIFERLFEAAEIAKFTPVEREIYEESVKVYRDLKNVIDTAVREGIEEGMEKGMEKGMKKGMKKGMEKGMKKGREKATIAAVIGFHNIGVSEEKIATALKIPVEKVVVIINNHK